MEGDRAGQAGPAIQTCKLAEPDPLVVLYVPHDGTQDDLLHGLPWHPGQTDRTVVVQILLPTFLVDSITFADLQFIRTSSDSQDS